MVAMSGDIAASTTAGPIIESDYELVLFRGKEAYVYQVPPAGTVSDFETSITTLTCFRHGPRACFWPDGIALLNVQN
jgi:hypothetical protein